MYRETYWARMLQAENRLWDYALAEENRATPRGTKAISKAIELSDRQAERFPRHRELTVRGFRKGE